DETFEPTICAASEGLHRGPTISHGKGRYAQLVWDLGGSWSSRWEAESFPFTHTHTCNIL
ncbi:hypothetical protein GOP47_0012612, partial [Adiantum capillus-veneris]